MPPQASQSVASTNAVQLIKLYPDDEDADVKGWCRVSEVIINSGKLSGVELLVALTTALEGRAASVLTGLRLEGLAWDVVRRALLARFAGPKLMRDRFGDVLRFRIGARETAGESAVRLWALIERVPGVGMSEGAVAGFVVSVLSSKDRMVRRGLGACAVTTRARLFRTLGGISLGRRAGDSDGSDSGARRGPSYSRFGGRCHRCGVPGHRVAARLVGLGVPARIGSGAGRRQSPVSRAGGLAAYLRRVLGGGAARRSGGSALASAGLREVD